MSQFTCIASIELPDGFEKTAEDRDFGHFIELSRGDRARICYWEKDNFFATPETAERLTQSLNRKPHSIFKRDLKDPDNIVADDNEYFAAAEALLQPGRVLPPYGFDIIAMKTQQLKGKRAFRVEFDAGKTFTSILMWDANPENGTLHHLWIDGPVTIEKQLRREFEACCASIEWT